VLIGLELQQSEKESTSVKWGGAGAEREREMERETETETETETEMVQEGEGEGEGVGEGKAEGEGEGEGVGEGKAEGQGVGERKAEGEGEGAGDGEVDGDKNTNLVGVAIDKLLLRIETHSLWKVAGRCGPRVSQPQLTLVVAPKREQTLCTRHDRKTFPARHFARDYAGFSEELDLRGRIAVAAVALPKLSIHIPSP